MIYWKIIYIMLNGLHADIYCQWYICCVYLYLSLSTSINICLYLYVVMSVYAGWKNHEWSVTQSPAAINIKIGTDIGTFGMTIKKASGCKTHAQTNRLLIINAIEVKSCQRKKNAQKL